MSSLAFLEIKQQVTITNAALLKHGYTLKQLDGFWKDCIKEARKLRIMELFFDGKSVTEMVEITGLSKSTISQITTEYWNDEMDQARG